jgi:hypothetical protein
MWGLNIDFADMQYIYNLAIGNQTVRIFYSYLNTYLLETCPPLSPSDSFYIHSGLQSLLAFYDGTSLARSIYIQSFYYFFTYNILFIILFFYIFLNVPSIVIINIGLHSYFFSKMFSLLNIDVKTSIRIMDAIADAISEGTNISLYAHINEILPGIDSKILDNIVEGLGNYKDSFFLLQKAKVSSEPLLGVFSGISADTRNNYDALLSTVASNNKALHDVCASFVPQVLDNSWSYSFRTFISSPKKVFFTVKDI